MEGDKDAQPTCTKVLSSDTIKKAICAVYSEVLKYVSFEQNQQTIVIPDRMTDDRLRATDIPLSSHVCFGFWTSAAILAAAMMMTTSLEPDKSFTAAPVETKTMSSLKKKVDLMSAVPLPAASGACYESRCRCHNVTP
jgi:hypothetical protein